MAPVFLQIQPGQIIRGDFTACIRGKPRFENQGWFLQRFRPFSFAFTARAVHQRFSG
jgi:hypothetical protein